MTLTHSVTILVLFCTAAPLWSAGIDVWDTSSQPVASLETQAFQPDERWTKIPKNASLKSLNGDAVVHNGLVAAVLRHESPVIELYSCAMGRTVQRATLRLLTTSGAVAKRTMRLSLLENGRSAVRVEAGYEDAAGNPIVARFRVKRGDATLEVEPAAGADRLRVECISRFVVLPDFFADDMVIDAEAMKSSYTQIPSENFVLQPAEGRDAIVMCTFQNREQDVGVVFDQRTGKKRVSALEIEFGQDAKIWLTILQGYHVWHVLDVKENQADQVIRLDWTAPFAAQWRVNFTRPDDLTDSWEMLLPSKKEEGYLKPGWLGAQPAAVAPDRRRWTTVMGWFKYPCWLDRDGRGYIQPLKNRALSFRGPALIYPINRLQETPSDVFTVVDAARNCLGVGPCEYILDIEGQKQEYKGRATCAVRDALKAIYGKGRQKEQRAEIEAALDDGLAFVTHIRSRIERYVDFGHEMQAYLQKQEQLHPDLKEFLTEMEAIAQEIDKRIDQRRDKIKTPSYVAQLNETFRESLIDDDAPGVMDRLEQYTRALTQVGGNQDELVGQCRWVVRTLRQRAGLSAAENPECAVIAKEIRARCQDALSKPATYEAARH